MTDNYNNLNELLSQNHDAGSYWNCLPDYVREHISSRGDNVKTLECLKDYAENLLRGDD